MLRNVICVAAGKGGVGKTSIAANLAGLAALSGWKTLLVDLDPQGNLCDELGTLDDERYDDGNSLLTSVLTGAAATVMADVRPGLDLVPAGERTKDLRGHFTLNPVAGNLLRLRYALGQLAGGYDLVICDTPPATDQLVKATLAASRFLLLATRGDGGSTRGLRHTATVYEEVVVEGLNPELEVLGIVRFGFAPAHTARLRNARARIEGVLGGIPIPVFDTFIRDAPRTADDVRDRGQLAFEYAEAAAQAPAFYQALRDGTPAAQFGSNADQLALDYLNLWTEVRDRYLHRRAELDREAS
jgi:chromosome partitioning protein